MTAQGGQIGFGGQLKIGEGGLLLLVVLKGGVLVLADLLHRGDLAEELLGVRGDEQLCGGVEIPVLEVGERHLADLELQLGDPIGLCLDIGLLELELRLATVELLLDTDVLLVDRRGIGLELLDLRLRLGDGERRVRSRRQATRGHEGDG